MKTEEITTMDLLQRIREHLGRHTSNTQIIITGGEPLLQKEELGEVLNNLKDKKIDLETNGTIQLDSEYIKYFRFIMVSPKQDWFKSLQQKRDFFNNWKAVDNCVFKFVIGTAPWMYSEATLKSLIKEFNLDVGKIFVMPGGATPHELSISGPNTWKTALRLNCNFSDRLHIRNLGK
jgi:organic radical activating enzyme